MPIPGEQPDLAALPPESSPVKRRLAAQYVRDARDRLTSTSGTRPAFDYELLRQYAQTDFGVADNSPSRCNSRLHVQHMERCAHRRHLDSRSTRHSRRHDRQVSAIPRTADARNFRDRLAATIRDARSVLRPVLDFYPD